MCLYKGHRAEHLMSLLVKVLLHCCIRNVFLVPVKRDSYARYVCVSHDESGGGALPKGLRSSLCLLFISTVSRNFTEIEYLGWLDTSHEIYIILYSACKKQTVNEEGVH